MSTRSTLSRHTRRNVWIDAWLFISALLAGLTGIYFLYAPVGGYRGGRNPSYNVQFLLDRTTWDDLHTWGGVLMIVAAIIHLFLHWSWVTGMLKWLLKPITRQIKPAPGSGKWNLLLNSIIGLSFVATAASGVYFLFSPGGRNASDQLFLFSRTTWDLIHTWAGVTLLSAGVLHFSIHWRWVVKVLRKMAGPASEVKPGTLVEQSRAVLDR